VKQLLEHDALLLNRHCERSEAIQKLQAKNGLLRRFAPRNDGVVQADAITLSRVYGKTPNG
jgi:hypothetical protein